ncbi:CBS domain-containing protein [Enterococcus sp. BWB1-3]|uniref:CBS domain-containing protein n=1 Tax=unclassified Enterococcus TaxID=2608891 RepID=UPI00192138FB|nr:MULTISPECIES: CBS domain-containing protein [unclassified Enterococcus]MBL1228548.1 CBS domain-containing protein [Enterococcus sp. BWB1-3]MCB5950553.1 CBS domain-containing protein [Enterococcus sp. BWT-B8]
MGHNAEQFLNSFNRIEKWLRDQLNNPATMGFSEMTRRMAKKSKSQVASFENDLLQMAQLRNAIVHERISKDFVIAEPNEWAVSRITEIEHQLIEPEKVLPKFSKPVTGFEMTISLEEILRIVAKKRYSQFPIYHMGKFKGFITVRGLGIWLAVESTKGEIKLAGKTAGDLLANNYKQGNYEFVGENTKVFQVEEMFASNVRLEAVLITKDGNPDGNLLGIIRPRDLYKNGEKE